MDTATSPTQADVDKFLAIKSIGQLAGFIGVKSGQLEYFLFYAEDEAKYRSFTIKKRNGKLREIDAPRKKLKEVQEKLQLIFQSIYEEKPAVHGFVNERSIITNAKGHVRKKILINVDLIDFFTTIKFGWIKAIFLSYPFNFNGEVANALTQLCCLNGSLPQGAPTSPVLSNFSCRRLDNALMKFAKSSKLHYTRYADDISLSTNLRGLPESLGIIEGDKLNLSNQFIGMIGKSGFFINEDKVRFALRNNRQEVTGLIVNSKLNVSRGFIRQIRSMLHAWEKFGIVAAAKRHFELPISQDKKYEPNVTSFQRVVTGKINHVGAVRGKSDAIFIKLAARLKSLAPEFKLELMRMELDESEKPVILTEGKTDIKHIKAALKRYQANGEFLDLDLNLYMHSDSDKYCDSELLKACQAFSKGISRKNILICIFDRDAKGYLHQVTTQQNFFKPWGNKIYSMLIPVPDDRAFTEICIEHLYPDADLTIADIHGRRIFLSTEFNQQTGKHISEKLHVKSINKLQAKVPQIIDSGVFDDHKNSWALSKNDFAEQIVQSQKPFDTLNIEGFRALFEHIQFIISIEKESTKSTVGQK